MLNRDWIVNVAQKFGSRFSPQRPSNGFAGFSFELANRVAEPAVNDPRLRRQAMSIVSSIALSGMSAAALRLQVSANNVANASSSGPLPGSAASASFPSAYVPKRVNQVDRVGGGTSASVGAVSPATVSVFDPTAPYADGQGMVASPNVDLTNEIVQQMMARISFAANVHVVKADAQMTASLLDITA